jgi:hypothetical protein
MYVQYGCGFSAPEGWINFDASPTLRWERLPVLGRLYTKNTKRFPLNVLPGDIVKGLPIGSGKCTGVFASHVLEHLSLDDFYKALANTQVLLAAGGIFRLVVPDLEAFARKYVSLLDSGSPSANATFLDDTHLGVRSSRQGLRAKIYDTIRSRHLWMWDEPSMRTALGLQGFTDIRRCSFGDCIDPAFSKVENPGRFVNALAMECKRA